MYRKNQINYYIIEYVYIIDIIYKIHILFVFEKQIKLFGLRDDHN